MVCKESLNTVKKGACLFSLLRMIYDVKQDGWRMAKLVIGGHVLDADDLDMSSSIMKTISTYLFITITRSNKCQVLAGDIQVEYLYAD